MRSTILLSNFIVRKWERTNSSCGTDVKQDKVDPYVSETCHSFLFLLSHRQNDVNTQQMSKWCQILKVVLGCCIQSVLETNNKFMQSRAGWPIQITPNIYLLTSRTHVTLPSRWFHLLVFSQHCEKSKWDWNESWHSSDEESQRFSWPRVLSCCASPVSDFMNVASTYISSESKINPCLADPRTLFHVGSPPASLLATLIQRFFFSVQYSIFVNCWLGAYSVQEDQNQLK